MEMQNSSTRSQKRGRLHQGLIRKFPSQLICIFESHAKSLSSQRSMDQSIYQSGLIWKTSDKVSVPKYGDGKSPQKASKHSAIYKTRNKNCPRGTNKKHFMIKSFNQQKRRCAKESTVGIQITEKAILTLSSNFKDRSCRIFFFSQSDQNKRQSLPQQIHKKSQDEFKHIRLSTTQNANPVRMTKFPNLDFGGWINAIRY